MFLLAWQKNSHQYTGLRNIRNRRSFVDLPSLPRCASMKMGDRRLARASPREGKGYPLSPRPSPALVGQPSLWEGRPLSDPLPPHRNALAPARTPSRALSRGSYQITRAGTPATSRHQLEAGPIDGDLVRQVDIDSTSVGQSRPLYLEPGFPALRGVWARPRLPGKRGWRRDSTPRSPEPSPAVWPTLHPAARPGSPSGGRSRRP